MRAARLTCVLAVVLASGSPIEAATIHVPAGEPSIQAGVSAAAKGDTVLVAPDTYTGSENRNIDFGGIGITLVSSGGPSVTIIDCEYLGRGFNLHSGEDTTAIVSGFTIRNATTPPGARSLGGGFYCSTASPVITDCVFEGCVADDGGAIWSSSNSKPRIEHCSFLGNIADDGGAIHTVSSGGVIRDCTFEDNTAELGGAILIGFFGEPLIDDCTFEGNVAEYGGGIYYMSAESSISNCVFYDNTAILGGGLYVQSSWNLPSVSGCTFARNTGGGVYNLMGELEFVRCIFAFDRSDVGLYCVYPPSITHCIVFGNAGGDSLCGNYFDNLFVDPLFCGMASGDFSLCDNSLCLPGTNPWGEQIGARDSDCGTCNSPVQATSWGLIKTLYRQGADGA